MLPLLLLMLLIFTFDIFDIFVAAACSTLRHDFDSPIITRRQPLSMPMMLLLAMPRSTYERARASMRHAARVRRHARGAQEMREVRVTARSRHHAITRQDMATRAANAACVRGYGAGARTQCALLPPLRRRLPLDFFTMPAAATLRCYDIRQLRYAAFVATYVFLRRRLTRHAVKTLTTSDTRTRHATLRLLDTLATMLLFAALSRSHMPRAAPRATLIDFRAMARLFYDAMMRSYATLSPY